MTLIDQFVTECDLGLAAAGHAQIAPAERPALPLAGRAVKRSIDVAVAVLALVVLLPIVLVAAIAVRAQSEGPALFRQHRVGRDGRIFTLYKLRTMVHPNDDSAHRAYVQALIRGEGERHRGLFKLVDDPRVTRVGRVLRRYSLDELPQLWNVLKGDMSLVGPRPSTVEEAALFDTATRLRLVVRPGLSGLSQVSGRSELDFEEMVELDVRYWRSWSLRLELAIMLRTPGAILTGRGAA